MGTPDGSGYTGPLTWVEYARDGRHDRGYWEQFDVLTQMQMAAPEPWRDSHVQIAHYGRELPFAVPKTYEREGREQDPERLNKLDAIPHLANLIIDIDAPELDVAREEAIKLVEWLGDADHYIYFSTRKGFHISIPWQILGVPKTGIAGLNWDTYSLMAQAIAEKVGLQHLDYGLYKKNGFIRAANTMHPNTGLYKVYITQDELKDGDLHELARAPRWDYPELDLTPSVTLQSLYQRCQIKADRRRSEKGTSGSTAIPLDPEVLERLRNGVTPCLQAIPAMSTPGNRNNTAFRAVMMMKYQGYTYDEADTYLMDWLGNAYGEIGAKSTLDSAWNGPFAGGCQWMRDTGYATESDCSACPIGQKRAKGKPEREEIADVLTLPMIDNEVEIVRAEMATAFDDLKPNGVYVIGAFAGAGKAQPLDAKVLTPTGWCKMGALKPGDRVVGSDGQPTEVTGVFPQGELPIYRVHFTDGTSVEASDDHLWSTWTVADRDFNSKHPQDYRPPTPKTTLEILHTLRYKGKRNHSIPMIAPVQFEEQKVPLDPYLLGVLLGDGSLSGVSVNMTCKENPDIIDHLQDRLPQGSKITKHRTEAQVYGFAGTGWQNNPLLNALKDMGIMGSRSADKFVPQEYLFNSAQVRLDLLRGLLDTDGHVLLSDSDVKASTVGFDSASEALADAVQFLVESFGGHVKRRIRIPTFTGASGEKKKGQPSHRLTLVFPRDMPTPFLAASKAALWKPPTKYPSRRFIERIEYVGKKQAQCISVAARDRLYATEHFILTHNTFSMVEKSIQIAEGGGRVLIAVRDTKKQGGLAEEMAQNIQELGFKGKVGTLHGRNLNPEDPANARVGQNCDNWKVASRISKMGHGVSTAVCKTCEFRPTCGYYRQFDKAFEPGIYITSHAQLHHLTNGEHEAFKSRNLNPNQVGDDLGLKTTGTGSPLQMIVVDEDILSTWLEEFYIGPWNLKMELQQTDRRVRIPGKKSLIGDPVYREFQLDKNWLRIIRWLDTITSSKGPVIHMLRRLAELEGLELQRVLRTILPDKIGDPDPGLNEGHKPFTVKLYNALMADLKRMDDGNPLVHANGDGIIIHEITQVALPQDVPLVMLDAYARPERYKAFLKAAGIHRPIHFKEYTVNRPPNVTYVLGAALTTGVVRSAINGQSWAIKKVEDVVDALKQLTSDGKRTLLVAKRELLTSELLKNLLADSPHLIIEDEEIGTLHFWRGRGINGAAGERIAIIQDPNPPPEAVLVEASALYADEPKLDTTIVRSRYDVVWAYDAENPVGWSAPRWDYADERLNVIHRTLREDEIVQMALRGRSVTTGAEILLFTDYVDSRMPARRVYHLDKMEVELDEEDVRTLVYDYLMGVGLLDAGNAVKALSGKLPSKHQRALRRKLGAEVYSKLQPCDTEIIERELEEWKRM